MIYQEDLNSSGYYWSFVVERSDIRVGNANSSRILNKCPFSPPIKTHIEKILRDTINIMIDEFNIRNFAKLTANSKYIYSEIVQLNKSPVIKNIDIIGDDSGLKVIISLGKGYMIDFQWTDYNDYHSSAIDWYKLSGAKFIRAAIEELNTTK